MDRSASQLRADALRIWQAGLEAVRSEALIARSVRIEDQKLIIDGGLAFELGRVRRIAIVGAGKAGAGMAAGIEAAIGPELIDAKQLFGLVNVPADCVRPLRRIKLHAARPAGCNEPTPEGMAGAEEILRIVGSLDTDDLCICLISGGGSALLPAPAPGITLADKLAVTRHLTAAGADIRELNTVRKQLSRIKGGRLARACRAGTLLTLIISDVLGDPLDLIASGPTVEDHSTPAEALAILDQFDPGQMAIPPAVRDYLRGKPAGERAARPSCRVENIIPCPATPRPSRRPVPETVRPPGYSPALVAAAKLEGEVEPIGRHLADMAGAMRDGPGPDCLISGGEGVVRLIDEPQRGLGGRNQQLALAALIRLMELDPREIAIVSAGTDGEDGPTDAAGALVDAEIIRRAAQLALDPTDFLRRNDAYRFFESVDGLVKTGPTDTNVGDLRVVTVFHTAHPAAQPSPNPPPF